MPWSLILSIFVVLGGIVRFKVARDIVFCNEEALEASQGGKCWMYLDGLCYCHGLI